MSIRNRIAMPSIRAVVVHADCGADELIIHHSVHLMAIITIDTVPLNSTTTHGFVTVGYWLKSVPTRARDFERTRDFIVTVLAVCAA